MPESSELLDWNKNRLNEVLKAVSNDFLKLAFVFGFTYEKEPLGEGLRRRKDDKLIKVNLSKMDFCEKNTNNMHQFLKTKGYLSTTNIN
jgi:hypothetical protein